MKRKATNSEKILETNINDIKSVSRLYKELRQTNNENTSIPIKKESNLKEELHQRGNISDCE